MESSAGVSLDAILLAMAALSLISEPVSIDPVPDPVLAALLGTVGTVNATEEASPPPNQDDTCANGFAVPPLPAVATDAPDPCLLCDIGPGKPQSFGDDFVGEAGGLDDAVDDGTVADVDGTVC